MTSLKKDFTSEAALQAFAASLGPHLQAGDVLLLDGDLGAGKTSFTKGLAKGLGITDYVKARLSRSFVNIAMVACRFIIWIFIVWKMVAPRI